MKQRRIVMSILNLLSIEGGIRAFFASLAASISFDLIFIVSVILEFVLVVFFVIKSMFSYEIRTSKSLDKLNQWLFVNKKIGVDNIKKFTELTKKCSKRISYNWQQYVLYREKAPSEYLSVENCIEKPLKASSYKNNLIYFSIISFILAFMSFLMGISYAGVGGDKVLNTDIIAVALSVPFLIGFIAVITVSGLIAKKNSNLNELYQNLHLFQRFIDNACIELPPFIDLTMLYTQQEIERGIPALREFLENRARKEKEEFEKARQEAVEYEKYDFNKAGIDGSIILDRAMNESEAYLNNKTKKLNQITQLEASLESLKRNFDNIQKDHQKKMQAIKENIDRLRQQQEETTSRIESNFLRKQQAQEVTKQEKEESDFEQQKRRYLVEKGDYEEEIKNINKEIDGSREKVENNMISEYETFYKKLCETAYENVDKDVKEEISSLKADKESVQEELEIIRTKFKRLEDENLTLRKKLDMPDRVEEKIVLPQKLEEERVETPQFEEPALEPAAEEVKFEEPKIEEAKTVTNQEEYVLDEAPVEYKTDEIASQTQPETPVQEVPQEEEYVLDDMAPEYKDYQEESVEVPQVEESGEQPVRRSVGRPRKEKPEQPSAPKKRGRPVGSVKKVNSPSNKSRSKAKPAPVVSDGVKRGKGRPRKTPIQPTVNEINSEITKEVRKIEDAQQEINDKINQVLQGLDERSRFDKRRLNLIAEIGTLKRSIKDDLSPEEMEEIEAKIEKLLTEIKTIE